LFRGRKHLTLDAKGRMVMPAKYRDRLLGGCSGQLVITVDRAPCLLLYPLPEWEEVEKKLAGLSSTNAKARRLKRFLMGNAEDCEMDGQGRVLLPAQLREFAGLNKQVVLVGQGNKFELWDEPRWNEQNEAWLAENDEDADLPEDLAALDF
jgi:MraZ protein